MCFLKMNVIDISTQILKIISILDLSDSIQLVLGSFPAIIRLSISYEFEINFYLGGGGGAHPLFPLNAAAAFAILPQ